MALSKIELKLGKKVIKLTPAEFEELKLDMRELDKQYHYYWCSQPVWQTGIVYKEPFYYNSNVFGSISNASDRVSTTAELPQSLTSFSGSILSTS